MKAVRISKWGNIEFAQMEEVPTPTIKANEVLVKVHAAGVNPIDFKVCEGYLEAVYSDPFPFTLGWDFSGMIVDAGADVSKFKMNQNVFGLINFPQPGKTFAEYVAVPVDQIAHKPQNTSFEEAASTPLAALTAWQALHDIAQIKAKQRVLIHAAAGGVGHFAVQFARLKGCEIIATASEQNHAWLKAMGAHQVIDYKSQAFEKIIDPVDVVFDMLGDTIQNRSLEVLASDGVMVCLSKSISDAVLEKAHKKNIQVKNMLVSPNQMQLQDIANLMGDGLVKCHIHKSFAFNKFKDALQEVKNGHSKGKVVLHLA